MFDSYSQRQHLVAPDSFASEVVAAGTGLNRIYIYRGLLQEISIFQLVPTPYYMDNIGVVHVSKDEAAVKRSAWIRRRSKVLQEATHLGECKPIHVEDLHNASDVDTKSLTHNRYRWHLHFRHNVPGVAPKKPA